MLQLNKNIGQCYVLYFILSWCDGHALLLSHFQIVAYSILDHWQPVATISGHYGPVQDIAWEPINGDFLISVSSDQTTRAHAPWVVEGEVIAWREIARPQIHGYNMQCVCMLTPVVMVSGADEKVTVITYTCWVHHGFDCISQVLRVFHSPRNFVDNLLNVSHVDLKVVSKFTLFSVLFQEVYIVFTQCIMECKVWITICHMHCIAMLEQNKFIFQYL